MTKMMKKMTKIGLFVLCLAVSFAVASSQEVQVEGGDEVGEPYTETENDLHTEEEEEVEEEIEQVYAVLMPWFVQAVGVVVFYMLTRHFHAVPYTAVLFVTGTVMGVGAVRSGFSDQLTLSISQWTNIDSEVLFCVFLPGLLFKDALEINFHLFVFSFWQLLLLAFPMVLAGTMLTACVALYVFPYGWTFHHALTFGAILAATDPVAVSALLNEVGAPPRLKTHISGESLLNDGSAVVFFTVFSGLFLFELDIGLGQESTVLEGFKIFVRMALGGVSVGMAFALALVGILYKLDRRLDREETVLQVAATVTTAYLSFYTAQVVCEMSGVIAVVTCGILTKAFGGGFIADHGQVMDSFWSLLEHLLNTVIFALGGLEFGNIIGDKDRDWGPRDWGYLILLYILVNIIRFFLMFSFFPIISRIGLKSCWQEAVFSSWSGLRGAVGIALALALDNEVKQETNDPEKLKLTTKLFGMVGGVAFLTLVINGSLSGPLLTKLGLADSTESRKRIVQAAEQAARRRMLDDFIHLMTDARFYFVDFSLVQHHCPLLRDLTAKELELAVQQNKDSVHPDRYMTPNLEHVLPYVPDSAPLRWAIEKSKRQMFMDPATTTAGTGTTGSQGFFELGVLEEDGSQDKDEDGTSASTTPKAALVQDIRIMFVELLRASYQAQIRDGELDAREYNGFLSYILLQSLDFAHDAASAGLSLNDWEASQLVSTDLVDRTEDFVKRLYRCVVFSLRRGTSTSSPQARVEAFRDQQPLRYQQLRLDVLRAFSFVDAHKEAQDRLRDEFGEGGSEVAAAFRIVMDESRAQVRKAEAVLRSKNKKQLKHVISHYLCIILQNKAARYIQLLMDSGVLLKREAVHYLEHIDENIQHIRFCRLDKHPGFIEPRIDESELKQPRPRRKRVKQKSIL
jgi:NhaP-type Na+/H+ or K+/H+ antiporter